MLMSAPTDSRYTDDEEWQVVPPSSAEPGSLEPNVESKLHATGIGRKWSWGPPARYVFALACFLGVVNMYCLRTCISVAIVGMVNATTTIHKEANLSDGCKTRRERNLTTQGGEFNWDADTQGLVLGSFYYGYILTQIPGGWIAERWGGKYIFGGALLIDGILALLTPLVTSASVYGLIIFRVLGGIFQGTMCPSMTVCMSKWIPPLETSKLGTFIHSGSAVGVLLTFPISSVLVNSHFARGWPLVFYFFGCSACVLALLWFLLVFESPVHHPRISSKERRYIKRATEHTKRNTEKYQFPFLCVMTSKPFWAIAASHVCNNWAYYTLLAVLPLYMSKVLLLEISENGLLLACPYLAMLLFQNTSGYLADCMRKRGFSTTFVRKLFNTAGKPHQMLGSFLGLGLTGTFLIALGFVKCDQMAAISVLIAAGCGLGASQCGHLINHLDIAPRFAGTLFGITNTLATIPGMVGPTAAGALTGYSSDSSTWQKVFLLAAGIDFAGALVYLVFASGEAQPWAKESAHVVDTTFERKNTWENDYNIQHRMETMDTPRNSLINAEVRIEKPTQNEVF